MFLQRLQSDTERETLTFRRVMETMETQTITTANTHTHTQTHSHTHYFTFTVWCTDLVAHTLTHTQTVPSYRSGCSTGSAERRKCRNVQRK